ncbi:MAG TPA: hypothetical protein VIS99_15810, partial [Terrimicrobiaceae bacterium]
SLDEALRAEGQSHYFNVTGAGLEASVIGNALERGIGYSGHRHLDLLDLEVVLPTGDVTQTSRFAFSSISPYHGGLGPDPTGLFCQSNFGIVTAATVPLHRRPEVMGGVLCHLADHRFLSDFISVLSDVIAEGACHGVPHLFNRERVVTTLSAHLEPARAAELKAGAASWTALIPIKGCRAVFEASTNYLKTVLGPFGRIEILGEKADAALSGLVQGHPSDVALASVAFSVFGRSAQINAPMEASGAGLIHVTPVVPLCGKEVCNIEHQTHQTLRRHGYEGVPLSLNALSARTAVLVVSLGFDRRCPEKTRSARKAAADLLKTYLRSGLVPYRLGLEQGNLIPPMERPWMRIISEIQRIFDPSGCMAPSRYEPLWRGMLPPQETNETKGAELCTTQ